VDTNILPKDSSEVLPDETPHGCINGWVYIGELVEDPETGEEEVEVYTAYRCRRCADSQ
jgi:hypothetical protein